MDITTVFGTVVGGSSPPGGTQLYNGCVAELVYAYASEAYGAIHGSSILPPGTNVSKPLTEQDTCVSCGEENRTAEPYRASRRDGEPVASPRSATARREARPIPGTPTSFSFATELSAEDMGL